MFKEEHISSGSSVSERREGASREGEWRRFQERAANLLRSSESVSEEFMVLVAGLMAFEAHPVSVSMGDIHGEELAPHVSFETQRADDLRSSLLEVGDDPKKEKEIVIRLDKEMLDETKILSRLLNDFYSNRNTSRKTRPVVIEHDAGKLIIKRSRLWEVGLESDGGSKIQVSEPDSEIRRQNLSRFQREFADFGAFLKDKFLRGEQG